MEHNPLANEDQRAAEEEVRAMLDMPSIRGARTHAEQLWRLAYGEDVPAEAWPSFDGAMDEYVANYLFKAAACDPGHPRFVRNFMGPHDGQGGRVPGARMGGDNPDNCYRLAGIGHGSTYVVRAVPVGRAPAHVSFTLVGNWGTSVTIQTIEWDGLEKEEDGTAVITIDDQPAGGRSNHLTTAPHVKFLFVRDTMVDWAAEIPLDLAIEKIKGPAGTPISLEERASMAAFRLIEEVPLYYWFTRLFSGRPRNSCTDPGAVTGVGGLSKQASGMGRLDLDPDEAAILNYDPAGAAYSGLVIHNWWFQTIDVARLQTSLTSAMSHRNADGTITCVASRRDPLIANWLDMAGLEHILLIGRWQGLPDTPLRKGPRIDLKVVPFDALMTHLPENTPAVDSSGRAAQLAARAAAYQRRIS